LIFSFGFPLPSAPAISKMPAPTVCAFTAAAALAFVVTNMDAILGVGGLGLDAEAIVAVALECEFELGLGIVFVLGASFAASKRESGPVDGFGSLLLPCVRLGMVDGAG
jgi:hypothetical protein